MNEKIDPVMKLAGTGQSPSRVPPGWTILRKGPDVIVRGPRGSLTMTPANTRAPLAERILCQLAMALTPESVRLEDMSEPQ